MSAYVRAATEADIDGICSLLHSKMNAKIPLERWYKLMSYTWLDDKPDCGRVVDSDGQVLGFCGMVYSDRLLGNKESGFRTERMVSMSSWYLDRSMRGKGLGRDMLIASISDPNMTYATLTNSPKPLAIQEAVGLRVLEDHRYLWHSNGSSTLDITIDTEIILQSVAGHERKILIDMADQPLTPFLLQADGCSNLLFFSIKRKAEEVTWYDLMYASDYHHFSAHAQDLANALLPQSKSVLAADGRFVTQPVNTIQEMLPVPRYFKSESVAPIEVDHLYSELQLLDLKLD